MRIATVNSSEVGLNRDSEDKVLLLQVEISSEIDDQTAEWAQAGGVDYSPPVDASVVVAELGAAWKIAIAADDLIEPETDKGEYQIYSSALGVKKAKIWLYKDGKIRIQNANGFFEMNVAGQVNINGNFTVDP